MSKHAKVLLKSARAKTAALTKRAFVPSPQTSQRIEQLRQAGILAPDPAKVAQAQADAQAQAQGQPPQGGASQGQQPPLGFNEIAQMIQQLGQTIQQGLQQVAQLIQQGQQQQAQGGEKKKQTPAEQIAALQEQVGQIMQAIQGGGGAPPQGDPSQGQSQGQTPAASPAPAQ